MLFIYINITPQFQKIDWLPLYNNGDLKLTSVNDSPTGQDNANFKHARKLKLKYYDPNLY